MTEGALTEVWSALSGYEPGRPFEAWCYSVLRYRVIDLVRKEQREWKHRGQMATQRAADLRRAFEHGMTLPLELGKDDLAVLETWPVAQRLALLCLSGLWDKVPPHRRELWETQYRREVNAALPAPFPPEALGLAYDLSQRYEVLAGALGMPRNTLSVWLYRYKARLAELHYVREMLAASES